MFLERMTSTEIRQLHGRLNLVVPFGSVEAHGPHLPLSTDTIITNAVLQNLSNDVHNKIVICPFFYVAPINFVRYTGEDGETNIRLSINSWVEHVFDVVKCYFEAYKARRILFVSWHDTYEFIGSLRQICYRLKEKTGMPFDALRLWIIAKEYALKNNIVGLEERHAAKIETSIIQLLEPNLVKKDLRQNIPWKQNSYLAVDWTSFTHVGIYGNAVESSAEIGQKIFNFLVSESTRIILDYFG